MNPGVALESPVGLEPVSASGGDDLLIVQYGFGATRRTRTDDLLITSELLYQLS